MLAMRRTLFVVPIALGARTAARGLRRRGARGSGSSRSISSRDAGLSKDPNRWFRRVEQATLEVIRERGSASGGGAAAWRSPRRRSSVVVSPGKNYEATVTLAPAGAHRPRRGGAHRARAARRVPGSSTQHRRYAPRRGRRSRGRSRPTRSRRWPKLRSSSYAGGRRPSGRARSPTSSGGPAGRPARRAPRSAVIELDEVDLGGTTGFVLPGDLGAVDEPVEPWVGRLPCGSTRLSRWGWAERTGTSAPTAPAPL